MKASELIKIRKVSSAAYKKLPRLSLDYGTAPTKFGNCFGAFEGNTLCYLGFYDKTTPVDNLKKAWPNALLTENESLVSPKLTRLFEGGGDNLEIYLKGTDFEIEVWEALLKIEKGKTVSYSDVAKSIGRPKAIRAAARAVSSNSIAYFVPCHRVIRKDGAVHKYASGPQRKVMMLQDEGAI